MSHVSTHNVRAVLSHLVRSDLTFHNGRTRGGLNTIHAFAARFPAELPRYFIQGLSIPGDIVLDPMAGSGATLLEGWLLSRNVIGLDLDPLAVRLCHVKTTWIDPKHVQKAGQQILDNAWLAVRMGDPLGRLLNQADKPTREFLDYWFRPDSQMELAALALAIREMQSSSVRMLMEVLLSSIIVTKSGGVSMSKDLAHSRPHLVADKIPGSPISKFEAQLQRAVQAFANLRLVVKGKSFVELGDSRHIPLANETVDLIVTSPPYANALDYVRAHKFSLVWLGYSIEGLKQLRPQYIGAERWSEISGVTLPREVNALVAVLAEKDAGKAKVLDKYFRDMKMAITEMYRVLKSSSAALVVVGPSTMHGLRIDTHNCLASIAASVGFEVVEVAQRSLDRDRRMMPARLHNNGQSAIEQRIHEEFVIAMLKP